MVIKRSLAGESAGGDWSASSMLRQDPPPPWGYFFFFWVIFGRRALIFLFVWKLLEKYEKWHHFCAHTQWWSPWRRKNVEKGTLLRRI